MVEYGIVCYGEDQTKLALHRMIWKDWNNQYIAESPYLTPIKVGSLHIIEEIKDKVQWSNIISQI